MDSKELYLKTNTKRLFFIAAIPGALSMLSASLYGIFDGMFVGKILGDTAFAAINLAFPFVIINFALADLIGVGSSAPISIALGAKDDDSANNIFSMACLMIVLTGALLGAGLFVASPMLLRLIGAEGELAKYAVDYVRVYAAFSPMTTIVFAMDNYLRISGKIKMSMWLNILMSVLTLALEYLFLGVLRLPIWSAAAANVISMVVCAVIAIYPFSRKKLQLKFVRPHFTAGETLRIVKCGLPTFLSNIAGRITSIAFNVALLRFGGQDAVSVFGIVMYVGDIIQPLVYGVCDSLAPAIGYNWGANSHERVFSLARLCYAASAIISLVSAAMMFFIPTALASLFTDNTSPAFLANVVTALRLYGISRLLQWFCFATGSYMSAVEKPLYSGMISVGSAFVFPMLVLVALYSRGLNGIWLNAPITMLFTAALSLVLLLRFRRDTKKLSEGE